MDLWFLKLIYIDVLSYLNTLQAIVLVVLGYSPVGHFALHTFVFGYSCPRRISFDSPR